MLINKKLNNNKILGLKLTEDFKIRIRQKKCDHKYENEEMIGMFKL